MTTDPEKESGTDTPEVSPAAPQTEAALDKVVGGITAQDDWEAPFKQAPKPVAPLSMNKSELVQM